MITMMTTKDDDKGDDKKLKDQSKNNSSESRTIQEFKRKVEFKNQVSRIKIQEIKIQDSSFKNQEKA